MSSNNRKESNTTRSLRIKLTKDNIDKAEKIAQEQGVSLSVVLNSALSQIL